MPKSNLFLSVLGLIPISFVSNLLMLTGPLFMMQVYDRVLASKSVPTLVVLTLVIAALYAFYAMLEAVRIRMAGRIANVFDKAISERLFEVSVYLKLAKARTMADPLRDADIVRQFLGGGGPLGLLDLPWVPIYLIVVFLFHPWLGWLAVGGALVTLALMIGNEFMSRRPAREISAAQLVRQRQADDARLNAESIVAMGMLASFLGRWRQVNNDVLAASRVGGDRTGLFSSVIKGFRFLLQSGVLALGAYLVIEGEMTGGLMIAASVVTSRALAPVEQVVGQWRGFMSARQAYQRINTALQTLPAKGRTTMMPLPRTSMSVRQLATGPAGAKTPLVQGVSFQLQAGEGLGILGLSGSGKSSIVRALVGVWPALAGEVRLDGSLAGHYDQSQMGKIIGYLPQRVELFSGTVAQNIARFDPEASSEDIIAAARMANIHDLISQLPNGYDTDVGEQGELLSAGQRQRVGLARALYANPFLIALDEPNSNLDAEGEAALSEAIHNARVRGAIVIVVAHRPSAVAAVDKLLYMRNGRLAAFGPKAEVLEQITKAGGDNVRIIKAKA